MTPEQMAQIAPGGGYPATVAASDEQAQRIFTGDVAARR